jgi:hypothetical protein
VCKHVFHQHQQAIIAITSLPASEHMPTLAAFAATDGSVSVWSIDLEQEDVSVELIQHISLGNKHAMALALSYLPQSLSTLFL